MYKTKEKVLHDQHLILFPDRGLFWKEKKLLIVTDPHFVKAQIFRDTGIPVPGGTTADDLKRLSCLMDQFRPGMLLFLGDLNHGRIDNSDAFERRIDQWRRRHRDVKFLLFTGNHDLRSGEPPVQFHAKMPKRKETL